MTFERRALGRDGCVLVDTRLEGEGFLAAFTERTGGASASPYESLNLSFAVGDDDDAVRRNRELVATTLAIDAFATAEQVHGSVVAVVGSAERTAGYGGRIGRLPGADAMSTTTSDTALAILTADCVPIVGASARQGLLAVAHAGWRGIAGGIVGTLARRFEHPRDVRVAIGPAIGVDHYEVGDDVASAIAAGTRSGVVRELRDGRVHVDLVATVRAELRAFGMVDVDDSGLCTACHPDRFFSYRRDGTTGRQAAIAVTR